jgi:hypothetical protein
MLGKLIMTLFALSWGSAILARVFNERRAAILGLREETVAIWGGLSVMTGIGSTILLVLYLIWFV